MQYNKILEVGPIPPPHAGWGVRIQYVLDGLRERAVECAALSVGPDRRVPRPGVDLAPTAWHYAIKILAYLLRGYRIHFHLNGDSPKAYLMVLYGAGLSLLFARRAVLTWHGGVPQRFFPKGRHWLADLCHHALFRLHKAIICNDDQIKAYLMAYGIAPAKVVPIQAFSRQYLEFQEVPLPGDLEAFFEDRTPRMFCYAYFRPEFYLPVLVDALRTIQQRYPDFGLVMVGFKQGCNQMQTQLDELGLGDHVTFVGDLDRNQFLTLLSRVDLSIRTPIRDGVSSSVLEALGLGVPVVAAANPLRPAAVVQYPGEDSAALADAVTQVLTRQPANRRRPLVEIPDTVADEIQVLVHSEPVMPASAASEHQTQDSTGPAPRSVPQAEAAEAEAFAQPPVANHQPR